VVNLNDTVRLVVPENHTLKPKITTLILYAARVMTIQKIV